MSLIDADKVLNIVVAYCPDDDGSCSKAGADLREMLDEIEALPEIDAEPIKHGHWIVADDGVTRCSICYGASDYERCFCGDCGAKMDFCGAKMDGGESE